MKVLWISNQATPKIAKHCGSRVLVNEGWKNKLSDMISKEFELVFCFPSEIKYVGMVDDIFYESFKPLKRENRTSRLEFIDLYDKYKPDLIHIHGTEYPHTLTAIEAANEENILNKVVVSIQGLASICAIHYTAYLPIKTVLGTMPNDLIKGNIYIQQKRFVKKGELELKAIRMVNHIIGRTEWDQACIKIMNHKARYHHNGELLRDTFYCSEKWELAKCNRHQVFMSQGSYSLKGVHIAIEAIALLKEKYPDIVLKVSGHNMVDKPLWKKSYYQVYITRLIKKSGLENHVRFVGFLDEKNMIKEYLDANVYILPSSIENSSNSLCEAQYLGTPVVASMVGGTFSLVENGKEGFLYQADSVYMLSHYISKIFDDGDLANRLSKDEIVVAEKRHNVDEILKGLIEIYNDVERDI